MPDRVYLGHRAGEREVGQGVKGERRLLPHRDAAASTSLTLRLMTMTCWSVMMVPSAPLALLPTVAVKAERIPAKGATTVYSASVVSRLARLVFCWSMLFFSIWRLMGFVPSVLPTSSRVMVCWSLVDGLLGGIERLLVVEERGEVAVCGCEIGARGRLERRELGRQGDVVGLRPDRIPSRRSLGRSEATAPTAVVMVMDCASSASTVVVLEVRSVVLYAANRGGVLAVGGLVVGLGGCLERRDAAGVYRRLVYKEVGEEVHVPLLLRAVEVIAVERVVGAAHDVGQIEVRVGEVVKGVVVVGRQVVLRRGERILIRLIADGRLRGIFFVLKLRRRKRLLRLRIILLAVVLSMLTRGCPAYTLSPALTPTQVIWPDTCGVMLMELEADTCPLSETVAIIVLVEDRAEDVARLRARGRHLAVDPPAAAPQG